jgi:hypothetical protein
MSGTCAVSLKYETTCQLRQVLQVAPASDDMLAWMLDFVLVQLFAGTRMLCETHLLSIACSSQRNMGCNVVVKAAW